jgi:hypothetical protein
MTVLTLFTYFYLFIGVFRRRVLGVKFPQHTFKQYLVVKSM